MSYNGEKRRLEASKTKQKVFESAVRLFSSRDYSQVSVDSIVKLAGVSKGSFYLHYASKDALVTEIIKNQVAKVDTDYRRFIDSIPDDISTESLFLSMVDKITDVLMEIGCDKMQILYKAQITKDVDTGEVTSYNREIYKMFSDVLIRGIKRGELKTDISLEILTKHFMMAIRGVTYEWCVRYPEFDYKAEALLHFNLLLKGLR